MSDNPFQPISGAGEPDAGEPSISAKEIAMQAASEAVRGTEAPPPLPSNEAQTIQFDQEVQTEQLGELPNPQAVPQAQDMSPAFASEAYSQLRDLGIDLPVSPSDIDPQFAESYEKLARVVLANEEVTRERLTEAEVNMNRVKDFAQRLGTPEGRERMLLSMALNNPEDFGKSMQIVERMHTDTDYAEAMRMKLEAQARMEAAQRFESAQHAARAQTKGRQVEGRTVRLAESMGVNVDLAKNQVAARILQNEAVNGTRDITLAEVDSIIETLARQTGSSPSVRAPQVASQTAGVPTQQPVANVGQTPSALEQAEASREAPRGPSQVPNTDSMDALRNAVRQSAINARTKGL